MKLEFDSETATIGNLYQVIVHHGSAAESPRDWDNVSTMVCEHRRYNLGDDDGAATARAAVRNSRDYRSTWEETESGEFRHGGQLQDCLDLSEPNDLWYAVNMCSDIVAMPLFLYDHSGITISTGRFSCPWDSGQVGFAFVTLDTIKRETKWRTMCKPAVEWARRCIDGETDVYDDYLRGNVYWFETQRATEWDSDGDPTEWEDLDSCGGYYGSDHEKSGLAESALESIRADMAERPETCRIERNASLSRIRELVAARQSVASVEPARAALQRDITAAVESSVQLKRELRLHYCLAGMESVS